MKYEQCLASGYNKSVKIYNWKNKASIKIYSFCMGKSQHFYLEMSFNLFDRAGSLLSWFISENWQWLLEYNYSMVILQLVFFPIV